MPDPEFQSKGTWLLAARRLIYGKVLELYQKEYIWSTRLRFGQFGRGEETPEDRAPRRPRCCARAGGGTYPTRREASAECPSLQIQFIHKKIKYFWGKKLCHLHPLLR